MLAGPGADRLSVGSEEPGAHVGHLGADLVGIEVVDLLEDGKHPGPRLLSSRRFAVCVMEIAEVGAHVRFVETVVSFPGEVEGTTKADDSLVEITKNLFGENPLGAATDSAIPNFRRNSESFA